jgi:hypothetical protein
MGPSADEMAGRRARGTPELLGCGRFKREVAMPTRAFAVAGLLLLTACSSSDYGRARATRFDRPYRGGAASVPDLDPVRSPQATALDAAEGTHPFAELLTYAAAAAFDAPVTPRALPQDYGENATQRRR